MRLERLLAIVMYLLNRKRASANELAQHFEVSTRTIQRDIDALSMAGFPVYAWQGRKGGYELLDTFKMDRNFLTSGELETLRTVLQGIESAYVDDRLKRLISKFEHMDRIKPQAWEEIRSGTVQIDLSGWGGQEALSEKLSQVREAIETTKRMTFSYANVQGEVSRRSVEPVKLILKSNNWYLFAYCLTKEAYRVFKLGRIADLRVLETTFNRLHTQEPPKFSESYPNDTRPRTRLVLKFHEKALGRMSDFFGFELIKKVDQKHYIVEVTYPEDEWVYGMILSFGNLVEVTEPKHIRDIVIEKAKEISQVYK